MSANNTAYVERKIFLSLDTSAVQFQVMETIRLRARDCVQKALRRGELVRPGACQKCGATTPLESHHEDYSEPLKVIFVCTPCHKQLSREITEQARVALESYKALPFWMRDSNKARPSFSGTTATTVFPTLELVYGRDDA